MKRNPLKKLAGLSAALLFSTTALAADPDAGFMGMDSNGDGKLTASEVSEQDELRTRWAEIDQDNDGAIDKEEFSAFEEMRPQEDSASEEMERKMERKMEQKTERETEREMHEEGRQERDRGYD